MAIELPGAPRGTEMAVAEAPPRKRLRLAGGSGITVKDRMFFTEQLALLLETGMSVYQALVLLEQQATNPALKRIIGQAMDDVSSGKPLSAALAGYPKTFSATYVNLIAASESGGFLHEVLTELLRMDEKREELRSTLVSAFTYPAFLIVFSILVVIFVLVFVFPKFGELFLAIQDQLPLTTVALLAISNLLTDHWPAVLLTTTAIAVAGHRLAASEPGRAWLDARRLGTPLIANIFVQLYLAQCLRVLSLSLAHGVPIVDALRACRDVISNGVFQRYLATVEARVTEGGKIADGFDTAPFVPDLAKQMIRTAEEAGNLAVVAERMADFYERELRKALNQFARIIEPVMLLVMGLVVGIIVSSLILPIFQLSHAVG